MRRMPAAGGAAERSASMRRSQPVRCVAGFGGASPAAASTSRLVIRPPMPVPATCSRSTPRSRASRRTAGAASTLPSARSSGARRGCRRRCRHRRARRRCSRRSPAAVRGGAPAARRIGFIMIGHQRRADLDRLPRLAMQRGDRAAARAGNFDQRLGRFHLRQRVVLLHPLADVHAPFDQLGLFQALRQGRAGRSRSDLCSYWLRADHVRRTSDVMHSTQYARQSRIARVIRSRIRQILLSPACNTASPCRNPVTRCTGASRYRKQCS